MTASAAALASLLPLPVAFPLAGAVVAPLLARIRPRLALLTGLCAVAASGVLLALQAPDVLSGLVRAHYLGHWAPVHGKALGIALAADPFGLAFALTVALIGTVLLLYTLSELRGLGPREFGAFACLFQMLLGALIGGALTADTVDLFVWFEVAALASYGLTGFFLERPIALEAAFKILVLTNMACFAVFIGAGLLYARHGALNFGQLHDGLAGDVRTADLVAFGLIIAGFATKAGLVPFHGWLADAHTAAPGPVSALFSGLMVGFGVLAIGRLVFQVFPAGSTPVLGLLMTAGVVSALLGAVMALAQDDLKRLLAYDTISQMGIICVGFGTGTDAGVAGGVYHLLNHAFFKSLLFLCAGAIVHRTGLTSLSQMGGLARRMPVIAAGFVLGAASIAGVPPLNGYASLDLIHSSLLATHQYIPYALVLLGQAVTIAALGKAAWLAFFRRREAGYEQIERLHPGMTAGLAILGACCVGFGSLAPLLVRTVMAPAASGLLHPASYAAGVLSGTARLPVLPVRLDYLDPVELAVVAGLLAAGLVLTSWYLRVREPRPVRLLRAVHTGSVHDYAGYATVGLIAAVAVLRLA